MKTAVTKKSTKIGVFDKNKCVIHLVSFSSNNHDDSDSEESSADTDGLTVTGDRICAFIRVRHPNLLKMMKRGDLVENVNVSGYRSEGRYIVDTNEMNEIVVCDLECDYDDYGGVLPSMYTITEFPVGYFDDENLVVNNSFSPGSTRESYWHADPVDVFLDTKKLGLKNLTRDDIVCKKYNIVKRDDKTQNIISREANIMLYIITEWNGAKYMICTNHRCYDNKLTNNKTQDLIDVIIEQLSKRQCFMCSTVSSFMKTVAKRNDVQKENILSLEFS